MRNVRGRSIRVGSMSEAPAVETGDAPVDPYRTSLYSAAELYDAPSYPDSLDARVYAWSRRPPSPHDSLVQALHDHALDEALTGWLSGRHLVGVMGDHGLPRGGTPYADAARLGALLGRSYVVATGGGPGAMEAANLGGRLAHAPAAALTDALERLAGVPSVDPSVDAWVAAARSVASIDPRPDESPTLGIPTWFYGHEPPNVFATAIAKYFRNATREAILLQICDAGIVFLPGAAGTVQEIFQDACENYYAVNGSVATMVLVGRSYWTTDFPAWPLLRSLARGRLMEPHVHLVDTVDEAAELMCS
ncbi:MAG: Rossmann fold nucleotide-binding protein [Nocardioides sp.]